MNTTLIEGAKGGGGYQRINNDGDIVDWTGDVIIIVQIFYYLINK